MTAVPEREAEVDSTAQYIEKLIIPGKDDAKGGSAAISTSPSGSTTSSRSSGRPGTQSAIASTRASKPTSHSATSRRSSRTSSSATARSRICCGCRTSRKSWSSTGSISTSNATACCRTPAGGSSPTRYRIDHPADRRQRRPPDRPLAAPGRCPAGRRQPRQRRDRTAGGEWAEADDPQIPRAQALGRRPDRQGRDDPHCGRVPPRRRPRPAQHPHLRRHRHRQDHAAELPQRFHPRQGADRHRRRHGRAAAAKEHVVRLETKRPTSKAPASTRFATW